MSGDPGDLANLRDLSIPAPVSFWPPAPGIWIALAALAAVLAIVLWRWVLRYRAAAYRRAALAELREIAAAIGSGDGDAATRVSAVMKRVAMVEYGRERVASLTGKAWLDFEADIGAGSDTSAIRTLLADARDGHGKADPAELRLMVAQAVRWVGHHRLPAASEA